MLVEPLIEDVVLDATMGGPDVEFENAVTMEEVGVVIMLSDEDEFVKFIDRVDRVGGLEVVLDELLSEKSDDSSPEPDSE